MWAISVADSGGKKTSGGVSMTTQHLHAYPYYSCHTAPERIARQRRVGLFSKVTGLVPVQLDVESNSVLKKLKEVASSDQLDHVSAWVGADGTKMLLVEPYKRVIWVAFVAPEFVSTEVPIELAPYCGQFNPAKDAVPGTRSYLLCLSAHDSKLKVIINKLQKASGTAPAWNSIGGEK